MKKIIVLILLLVTWKLSFASSEITIGGKTAQSHIIQVDGVSLRPRAYLNFTGGVTGSDTGGKTVIDFASASSLTGLSDVNTATATAGRLLIADGTDFESVNFDANISIIIDGAGSVITTGEKGWSQTPYAFNISSSEVTANTTSDITVDIWVDSYDNYPPTNADSICASDCPSLSNQIKSQDISLGTWTTSVGQFDYIKAVVDSASTLDYVTITLKGTRI